MFNWTLIQYDGIYPQNRFSQPMIFWWHIASCINAFIWVGGCIVVVYLFKDSIFKHSPRWFSLQDKISGVVCTASISWQMCNRVDGVEFGQQDRGMWVYDEHVHSVSSIGGIMGMRVGAVWIENHWWESTGGSVLLLWLSCKGVRI